MRVPKPFGSRREPSALVLMQKLIRNTAAKRHLQNNLERKRETLSERGIVCAKSMSGRLRSGTRVSSDDAMDILSLRRSASSGSQLSLSTRINFVSNGSLVSASIRVSSYPRESAFL